MLRITRHFLCRVSTQNYKTRITPETRKAIAGLDADTFGFSRADCCGPAPPKLPGSFRVTDHVFLNTIMPPTAWAKQTQNVPAYMSLTSKLREQEPSASITVCHAPAYPALTVLRFTLDDERRGQCQQYTLSDETVTELPWKSAIPQFVDRTLEYFIFVCAHRARDARCGYCGPVLVDVMSQAVQQTFPDLRTVHVIACSHFGGHVYAGNVLIYSRHGGVCFGCVTPNDVETILDIVRNDDGVVPDTLKDRVRGRLM